MSEKLDNTTQIQAFSFKKKPLENYINNSNVRSVISDMIPQSSSRPTSSNIDPRATDFTRKLEGHEGYNNINYDEQIRAPRMSSVTQSFKDKEEDKDNSFVTDTPRMEEGGLWSVQEDTRDKEELDDSYIPANFDLSQPTRRFSSACDVASDVPDTTILSYTTNNYIYERNRSISSSHSNSNNTSNSNTNTNLKGLNLEMLLVASPDDELEQSNLVRALNNLKKNMTSRERSEGMKTSRIKHRPHASASHLSDVNGTDLQQVYRLKKPLCIPAVLRPQSLSPPSSLLSPTLPCSAESSPKKMNYSISFDCQALPGNVEKRQPAEPTHTHWKPNSFTSYCMKCFEPFGNFFIPQCRRRHHCRFCGQIFCYDCLWQKNQVEKEEDSNPFIPIKGVDVKSATVLDAQARFVIPIYLNLHANSKIQSLTDLYRNCKVCKDCGYNYHMLVTSINSNLSHFLEENHIKNFTRPVIFIENSYVKNSSPPHRSHHDLTQRNMSEHASIETDANSTHPDAHDASATATICASSSTSADPSTDTVNETSTTDPLRKSSIASVPSDWTWSSF